MTTTTVAGSGKERRTTRRSARHRCPFPRAPVVRRVLPSTEIKIGYLLPLTGAAPTLPPRLFRQGFDASNAYWDYVNAQGGIDGRQVTVVIEDTESQAEVGKDKAKKLVEDDKVFAIVVLDRLENQEAIGRYLNDREVPTISVQTPPTCRTTRSGTSA